MNNKFLQELQEDIFDRAGYYTLYMVIAIPSFIITIEQLELYCNIFRVFLTGIALLFLVLIYFKCKDSRNEKQNKIIIQSIFLFLLLTTSSITQLIRHLPIA